MTSRSTTTVRKRATRARGSARPTHPAARDSETATATATPAPTPDTPRKARARKKPTPAEQAAEDAITALWFDYKRDKNEVTRNHKRDQLLLHYTPLARYVASRVHAGLPRSVDMEDLTSYAIIGLIDAVNKFQPKRGYKFETYAMSRIRGAIIDELRALDWVPRSVRSKIRTLERAITDIENETGRTPTDEEVADRLGMTMREYHAVNTHRVTASSAVGLDDVHKFFDGGGVGSTLGDRLTDDRIETPGEDFEREEQRQALARAVRALPERDRIVVTLYYFENLTLAEIGQVLGVTESRVCQLHTKATQALKDCIEGRIPEFDPDAPDTVLDGREGLPDPTLF